MKSTDARSPKKLQGLDYVKRYRDSNHNNEKFDSHYGLLSFRRQAIIGTIDSLLSIRHLKQTLVKFQSKLIFFSLKKIYLKVSPAKWWPFCFCRSVLSQSYNNLFLSHLLYIPCISCTLWDELAPKPLHEPFMTSYQWGSVAFTWEQFHREWWSYYSA